MRSTRRPPHRLERTLVLVLVGFIAVDLLLVLPAFASELRLDRLHPSLPIVNLRPLAAGRARIADGLGEEFTAPVRELAGELKQAGAKAFNAVLFEVNTTSEDGQGSNEAAFPLAPSATPTPIPDFEPADKSAPTQTLVTGVSSPEPSPSLEATLDPDATVLPSPTVDFFETAVSETATALALPKKTKLPPPTKPPGPSYTPTSILVPTEQLPSMTPTKKIVATATLICAIGTPGCQSTPDASLTPTEVPSPTLAPTHTPLPTTEPTNTTLPTPVPTHSGPVPAFPGAEGWGAWSIGGRGGEVIEVTNLNNSGLGSLRNCAQDSSGPRICVFRVAGEIVLTGSRLRISNSYLTIAGQTAPGDGITLRGDASVAPIINFENGVHDVIIRFLTIRAGQDYGERDAVTFRSGRDIILDHVTMEWATDEIVGINPSAGETVSNITLQRSILAEAFRPHSTGILMLGQEEGDLTKVTLHHNLFAHNAHRNPRVDHGQQVEVINNVIYNWHSRAGTTVGDAEVDFVANYFKAGPWSGEHKIIRHQDSRPDDFSNIFADPSIFAENNLAIPFQPSPSADNWNLFAYHVRLDGPLPTDWRRFTTHGSSIPVTLDSAQAAYDSVLEDVGDNAGLDGHGNWAARADIVDKNLINDVNRGTGPSQDSHIDHENDFGGYPSIDPGVPYQDSDHDGMPDAWENSYCFDPSNPADGPGDADGDGYTNIEEFLNGTHPTIGTGC